MALGKKYQSMIKIHPEILTKNEIKEFAILTYEEYETLMEYIRNLEDLVDLRDSKEETKDEPTITLEKVNQEFVF